MDPLTLRIIGTPKPQARPRFARMGKFVKTYNPKNPWRDYVYEQLVLKRPAHPFDGPLRLILQFYMPRPKSRPKRMKWNDRRPDLDNLLKAIWDAGTDAGVWVDDSRFVEVHASKPYADEDNLPGLWMVVERAG